MTRANPYGEVKMSADEAKLIETMRAQKAFRDAFKGKTDLLPSTFRLNVEKPFKKGLFGGLEECDISMEKAFCIKPSHKRLTQNGRKESVG